MKNPIKPFVPSLTDAVLREPHSHDISFHLSEDEAKVLALFDPLTGLPNRRAIEDRLERKLASAKRRGKCGALLFIDLDHFKSINDAFGHRIGDGFLVQVAERLTRILREEDTAARLGGDEFLILLPELGTDLEAASGFAQTVAEKVIRTLARTYLVEAHVLNVGASIGISLFPENHLTIESILEQADLAMYRGKGASGKVHFFNQNRDDCMHARLEGSKILQECLIQNQFELGYQPQMDSEGHVLGFEACLQWHEGSKGLPPLSELISSEENRQHILSIGIFMLTKVCRVLKHWSALELDFGFISLEVFPAFFLQADFVAQLEHILEVEDVDPRRLVLALKEDTVFGQCDDALEKMEALRNKGIRFALDDFGQGRFSLRGLQKLPIALLKINKALTSDLSWRSPNGVIVKTILAMAQEMEIEVVAEGVVSEDQMDLLRKMGCRFLQGNYLSEALSEEVVRTRLSSARSLLTRY